MLIASFKTDNHKKKKQFTINELNKLFSSKNYLSYKDDYLLNKNTSKEVNNARFWIPLIGLFQGMRMNEACQLYTEDIVDFDDKETNNSYLIIKIFL